MSEDMVRGLLQKAIELVGSQGKLGAACNPPYTQHAIWHALKIGRVSPTMAVRIEHALDGAIPAEKLCPELHEWLHNTPA